MLFEWLEKTPKPYWGEREITLSMEKREIPAISFGDSLASKSSQMRTRALTDYFLVVFFPCTTIKKA